MHSKTCIIVCGPTAVGKTSFAIQLAQHFHTEIISADSRQCYRELDIGVAKPSASELAMVKHYFINSHSIHQEVNAAIFEQLSMEWASQIFKAQDVAVMVGGTGLYIQAFCKGLDAIPPVRADVRRQIIESYEQYGLVWLQEQVKQEDPDFYAGGEIHNPQRLMRALEIKRGTGASILEYRSGSIRRPFNIIKVGLDIPRQRLYEQINNRVLGMMHQGLLAEATALFPYRSLNALQTVGYTELFQYLEEVHSLEKAVELIQQHTRNYAKRQLTWFRRDAGVHWFSPEDPGKIIAFCEQNIPKTA